jgi:dihydropteroate synthase
MIDPDRHIYIMGIVNLTDDSYFAESRCASVDSALKRVGAMLYEGADIIDIGACSTRPGAEPVGAEEEWSRLEPVLTALKLAFPEIRLSIDTTCASVVEKAWHLIGDFIVNDISAGEDDPMMLPLVGRLGLEYIAMHKRGNPKTMQDLTCYDDVTEDLISFFSGFSRRAASHGIRRWVLDPGFGFAKTLDQNYQLMRGLEKFRDIRCEDGTVPQILVGVSRKSMIYKMFDISPEEALPQTQVLHLAALQRGADILRVHDVAVARHTAELYRLLYC